MNLKTIYEIEILLMIPKSSRCNIFDVLSLYSGFTFFDIIDYAPLCIKISIKEIYSDKFNLKRYY